MSLVDANVVLRYLLDDLISGQAPKVKAHKAHKKGLMQQLFPAIDDGK
ncbi:hypothetical protein JKG47_05075 [Acidithiobacillus sp. MC6.1]|nr:hypothetical protein [Acidithiobacillus sp. MC6.1]